MAFLEKIRKKTKGGLAALVIGGFLVTSGTAYSKEIKNEGWPLPDETKYLKMIEEIEEFSCKYKNEDLTVKIKVEGYGNFDGIYKKYSFQDKVFMYITLESSGKGDAYKSSAFMDRDNNGSLETKYDLAKEEDVEELEENCMIPKWIWDEVINN